MPGSKSIRAQAAAAADNKSTGNKQYGIAPRVGASMGLVRQSKCCGNGGSGRTLEKN